MPTLGRVHGAAHHLAGRTSCRHQKRLSDVLDALSDERLPARAQLEAFAAEWQRGEVD